jgi:flagellar protein FliL
MKGKMMATMVVILLVILLAGAVAIIVINKLDHTSPNKAPSADEVVKQSVDIPEITTNLKNNNNFIKISFKLESDSKKAEQELAKRDFQVKDIIIDQLSEMSSKDLEGQAGKDKLRVALKDKISKILQDGKIVNVYITSYVIQ